jgi:hypothetical protein
MNSDQPNINDRYRTMLILWFAMAMSLALWLALIHFKTAANAVNLKLGFLLVCLGFVPMSLSFLVKQMLVGRAIERQEPMLVQQAYVTAWALCEAAALLGLLAHFLAASPHYYLGFVIGGGGIVLHFPQKKHLLAASGQEF